MRIPCLVMEQLNSKFDLVLGMDVIRSLLDKRLKEEDGNFSLVLLLLLFLWRSKTLVSQLISTVISG